MDYTGVRNTLKIEMALQRKSMDTLFMGPVSLRCYAICAFKGEV
jgi:hypothetical protein